MKTNLYIDYISWLVFGLIFVLFPKNALLFMTNIKLDNVHIHMMRAFGFLCIYSSLTSYIALKKNNLEDNQLIFKSRLLISVLLLINMLYTQSLNNNWSNGHYFGMLGLILNIVNVSIGILI